MFASMIEVSHPARKNLMEKPGLPREAQLHDSSLLDPPQDLEVLRVPWWDLHRPETNQRAYMRGNTYLFNRSLEAVWHPFSSWLAFFLC